MSRRIRTSAVFFIDGKLALMRRLKNIEGILTEYYTLIGGGKEVDETVEQAVVREVKEEVNVDVKVEKQLLNFINEVTGNEEYTFLCDFISGEYGEGMGPEYVVHDPYNIHEPVIVDKSFVSTLDLKPEGIKEVILEIWK